LVYLCGFTLDHRNPRPGLERTLTLRTLSPLARAGFQVYFTNRWPGMAPEATFSQIAERHAEAIRDHFSQPVNVLGASTGGSWKVDHVSQPRPRGCYRTGVLR